MDCLFTIISEVGKCLYDPVKRHCSYLFCYARNVETLSAEVTKLSKLKIDVDNKLEEERRTSQKEPKEAVKQMEGGCGEDLKLIQGDIAESLGLNHIKEVNTEQRRASLLFDELKKYERVLIILDDVWEKLEMAQVGIPSRGEHPCCKIIITTRNRDVCDRMRIDIKIAVQPWSLEDSRKLFDSKVGQDMILKNPKLEPLANEIIKECGGSPLAIVTLALALVGHDNEVIWKDALRSLRSSDPSELETIEGMDTVIKSIKYSYNNLPGEGKNLDSKTNPMKLCFLFCSIFPEDYDINLFDLRTYGIGEGFLRVDGSQLDARGRLESYIERLKARNLLLDSSAKNCVRMHDVVRDVARLIASKEHGFIGKARIGLNEWPKLLDNAEDCKRMSLMNNDIRVLPADNYLNMPELRTLLLTGNRKLKQIPDNFFAGMNKLVNLDLSKTAVSCVPPSMSCLTSLRTLNFASTFGNDGERDMSLIGKLKKLEILILGYEILKVPNGLGELTNLKVLHLGHNLESIPAAVIPKLLLLEELCLETTFSRRPSNYSGRSATLAEVASLKHLTTLQLAVKSRVGILSQDIPLCWNNNNLQEFIICLGSFKVPKDAKDLSKFLFIENLSHPIKDWVLFVLQKSEDLHVHHNKDFWYFPCLNIMDNLKLLEIYDWAVMKNVANIEEVPQAANNLGRLESLRLRQLPNLKRICQGPLGDGFVMNLKELIVSECEKIQIIMPLDLLQASQSLESLEVTKCASLTHVVSINVEAPSNIASDQKVQLGNQHSTHLILPRDIEKKKKVLFSKEGGVMEKEDLFPKLNKLILEELPNLVSIFNIVPDPSTHFGKQQQRSLQLGDASVELQASAPNIIAGVGSKYYCRRRLQIFLQKLRELDIKRCHNLTSLFKLTMIQEYGSLHSIQEITVHDCRRLKWIVVKEEDEDGKGDRLSYDHLTFLELEKLPELMSFYSWDTNILLSPSLEQIYVIECENFQIQSILPVDILETSRLISLKSLRVKGCKSLIQVVSINAEVPSIINSDKAQLGEHSTNGKMKKLSFNIDGVILERGGLFPGLDELILEELPNLMSICLLQPAESKYLGKQLKQGLEDASIAENDQMPAMRALAPNLAVFQNLTTLWILGCHNLKYLFSLNMFQNGGLQKLQQMDIIECKNLKWILVNDREDIFEGEKRGGDLGLVSSGLDEGKGSLLCRLKILRLEGLPELLSFYSWDDSLLLPSSSATILKVVGCPKLGERRDHYPPERESLNDQEQYQMTPIVFLQKGGYKNLRKLEVRGSCNGGILHHVFGCLDGGVAAASGLNMGTSALNQLEELALGRLPNLSSIIYYGSPPKLPPLERIFLNLKSLEVVGCNKLRHLFPPPHALSAESSLPQLAIMRVSDCAELVSCVIIKEREMDKFDDPLFAAIFWPKLKELDLLNLPNLLCLYGEEGFGSFLLRHPSLTRVRIRGCPKLWKHPVNNNIASSSNPSSSPLGNRTLINLSSSQSFSSAPVTFSLQKLQISGFDQTQHVFGFEEGICSTSVFHKLEALVLEDLPRLESICRGYIPPGSFANLEEVKVRRCHSLRGCLQFSLILAGSLQDLESLVVESCEKLEKLIMSPDEDQDEGDQKVVVVLPRLKNLILEDLPELTSIYGAGDAFLQLPSLRWTRVNNCSKLKQLPFGPWANPRANPWADLGANPFSPWRSLPYWKRLKRNANDEHTQDGHGTALLDDN
ncbi:hypothetical protein H6P81_001401 [Aristolochia fimbriata]|uniref:NB-ARC domain-containing protein n=1 Tax=Aristolochia fimbriata TaxID=158543 RepID=A0AAV7F739_ARIFI|nr:hypothetical protein H6P81_001401 [Aristolochia fimbriata]